MNHRLHALCPYFAMFPPEFVKESLLTYTGPGDVVFDGFSGRGTTLLESLLNGREAIACDINPVAYCVSAAKANPPSLPELLDEIDRLEKSYQKQLRPTLETERRRLPGFFPRGFYAETLRQLLFLRSLLMWRRTKTHRFLCALILGHLHGELNRSNNYLSNQLPHSISPKPSYSLGYWRKHDLWPPRRDVFQLLRDRAAYRLAQGGPPRRGNAACCDIRRSGKVFRHYQGRVATVITSPPYLDVTKFEEDQWLRLWFLGGPPHPTYNRISKDDRYRSQRPYWDFLVAAWKGLKPLLREKIVFVCRIGAKNVEPTDLTRSVTSTLRRVWPRVSFIADPLVTPLHKSQAKTLTPHAKGCRFEIDLVYELRAN